MMAGILICGTTAVFTSCSNKDDNPVPSPTLPKSYNLIADEYIVGSLDLFVHEDKAFVEQLSKAGVQADLFVEKGVPHSYNGMLNDSPQTIRFKELRDASVKEMFK